jgi:REP element-mobilizing transposase RayT
MSANNGKAMSQTRPNKRHGLPEIIRAFKSFSARTINHMRGTPGTPVWQRNYYEHIIRNERELFAIQRYIRDNPKKWGLDSEIKSSETPISA